VGLEKLAETIQVFSEAKKSELTMLRPQAVLAMIEYLEVLQNVRLVLSKISSPDNVSDTCLCEGCRKNIEEAGEMICETCGYKGKFVAIGCQCYDENAMVCRPGATGPGCPHGSLTCPVCQEGDADVDPWRLLAAIQMAMRGEKPEEIGKILGQ
jgi:hypothetical protein